MTTVRRVSSSDERSHGDTTLILDELHNLSAGDHETLIIALHHAKAEDAAGELLGSGLPLIPALTGRRRPQIAWEDDALTLAVACTEGCPHLLREVGRWAWRQRDGDHITEAGVERRSGSPMQS